MDEPSQAGQSATEINPVTPLPEEGKSTALESNGDSTSGAETGLASCEDEDGEEDTLERASELFEKGSKAIEDGDFVEAVDSLSRALEIRVANYGELAPECAISYYKYGCALLYKAQDETDPLGNVLKNSPKYSTEDTAVNNVSDSKSSTLPSTLNKHASSPDINDLEGGSGDKNEEDEIDGCKEDDEELGEAEEDDSDLDFAWKMLDIARAIYERSSENSFEKVNVLAALGEVSMERA
ncbi:hypothetical protein KSP40_PGU019929 [Platanthera guangdongensis]|uniref:Uncharacterized protein n=1 Tax=Platanthera guangdongensis TaxID=2320717 RepID=A0ABR2MZN3_9ASPA